MSEPAAVWTLPYAARAALGRLNGEGEHVGG